MIARLDKKWTKRNIQLRKIDELSTIVFPFFSKPVIPKLFQAGIFKSKADITAATNGLSITDEVIVSDIVGIEAEARAYVMEGNLMDIAIYEGDADIETGRYFLEKFISYYKPVLPKVVVIDIAFNNEMGWFVLEFNSCWGSGLNNCKAENVIDCIIGATVNNKSL